MDDVESHESRDSHCQRMYGIGITSVCQHPKPEKIHYFLFGFCSRPITVFRPFVHKHMVKWFCDNRLSWQHHVTKHFVPTICHDNIMSQNVLCQPFVMTTSCHKTICLYVYMFMNIWTLGPNQKRKRYLYK